MWCSFFQRQFRFLQGRLLVMRRVTLVTALVTFILSAQLVRPPAALATKFWKNSVVTGNWSTSNNWSASSAAGVDNGGAPIQSEAVDIVSTDGTARTVTYDVNAPALGYGFLSIDLTGAGAATNTLSIQNNNTLAASAIVVGGYNGSATTNGRGAIIQSAGSVKTNAFSDLAVGDGAGSTGTYTLSGSGTFEASQSEYIGLSGNGTFTQNAGTNTIDAGATGALDVGAFAGSHGTYNLNGGTVTSNKSEYVGDSGTGTFNQTAGTNSIIGSNNLYLGFNNGGGVGTYAISGTGSLITGGDIVVGNAAIGVGTLSIQNQASVSIANNLTINSHGTVNLNGGTLRFTSYSLATGGAFNYTAGTIQLGGGVHFLLDDGLIDTLFGNEPVIPSNKGLTIEGLAVLQGDSRAVKVAGGKFTVQSRLDIGDVEVTPQGDGQVQVTNGGTLTTGSCRMGVDSASDAPNGLVTVSGAGSSWTNNTDLTVSYLANANLSILAGGTVTSNNTIVGAVASRTGIISITGPGSELTSNTMTVGSTGTGTVTIANQGLVNVPNSLAISATGTINLQGGTLRINTVSGLNRLNFLSGTIQLPGNRDLGNDTIVSTLFGAVPVITTTKGLTIEGTATVPTGLILDGGTLRANSLIINGAFHFGSGLLELTGGTITGVSSLAVPTDGEFRANGGQSFRIAGAAGSTITATGNLTLGDSAAVNGFYTDGTLTVGANLVTLSDLNDAAFDTGSLITIGSGASSGTVNAVNGLTLDFGGNVTGFGAVTSPNNLAKPLINNGHITGNSLAQPITLSGYVKGAGTFSNVNFTGTFSPGLSPTISSVGNIALSPTSTLIMELGGTTRGSAYDAIVASGNLSLGGALQLSLINGFLPAAGQSFDILDWNSLNGAFDSLVLPSLSAGLSWNTSQLYTSGALSVVSAGLAGDYNGNGIVDAADYTVWRDHLGQNVTLPNDTTPGTVTQADFDVWKSNFGNHSGSGSGTSAPVPEPGSLMLLLSGTLAICSRRGQKNRNSSTRDTG